MSPRRIIAALVSSVVLATPAAALAQSAGDDQYQDPFGGESGASATPTPRAPSTPSAPSAPAPAPAPAAPAASSGTATTAQAAPSAGSAPQLPYTGSPVDAALLA